MRPIIRNIFNAVNTINTRPKKISSNHAAARPLF